MFFLYGFDESVRNVYLIAHPHLGGRTVRTIGDLREPYLDFLASAYPNVPVNRSADRFVHDDKVQSEIAAGFVGSNLDDMQQHTIIGDSYDPEEKRARQDVARSSLDDLLERDERYTAVFDLVVHSIFVSRTNTTPAGYQAHAGSASGAIGSIWLSMRPDLTDVDVVDLFAHEFTHQLMFIDELVHGHFDYSRILHEENFAYSAILNKVRPLDKVVHSIVVATELILTRQALDLPSEGRSVHPDDDRLATEVLRAVATVNALPNRDELVSSRVVEIIDRCAQTCRPIAVPTGATR
jgi:hypothetical protein